MRRNHIGDKGGRPRLNEDEKKRKIIGVRLTVDEARRFEKLCRDADKKPSPFMREIINVLIEYYLSEDLEDMKVLEIINPVEYETVERIDHKDISVDILGKTKDGKEFSITNLDINELKESRDKFDEMIKKLDKIKKKKVGKRTIKKSRKR